MADGERGALIGPRGDLVWMCFPRWNDAALCSAAVIPAIVMCLAFNGWVKVRWLSAVHEFAVTLLVDQAYSSPLTGEYESPQRLNELPVLDLISSGASIPLPWRSPLVYVVKEFGCPVPEREPYRFPSERFL